MMKKIVLLVLVLSCVNLMACGSNSSNRKTDKDLPIEYMSAVRAIDCDNYSELVGYYDYTFAGTVTELVETQYEETTMGPEDEKVTYYDPYTVYKVEVIDNIKGKLKKNKEVLLYKTGGLNKDGDGYILFEGDALPEVGKTYIFNAWVKENGELGISGENSNIFICESKDDKNVKSYDIYKEFVKAYKEEVKFSRDRYTYKEK